MIGEFISRMKSHMAIGQTVDGKIGSALIDDSRRLITAPIAVDPATNGIKIYGSTAGKPIVTDADGKLVLAADVVVNVELAHATDSVTVYGSEGVAIDTDGDGHVQTDILTVPGRGTHEKTNTVLAANGVFESTVQDVTNFVNGTVFVNSNVGSAVDGLVIRTGMYADAMIDTTTDTLVAGVPIVMEIVLPAQFIQVSYTNGATLQTSFQLGVMLSR